MKENQPRKSREAKDATRRRMHEAEAGMAGALAGAAMGAVVGPPGAVGGAFIGGLIGAFAVAVVEKGADDRAAEDRKLDAEIGASGIDAQMDDSSLDCRNRGPAQ
jgi:phage tail tape-measure protein